MSNGKTKSINKQVTQATVDAHVKGKNATIHEAIKMVTDASGNHGTFYNKVRNKLFKHKDNIDWVKAASPPHLGNTPPLLSSVLA